MCISMIIWGSISWICCLVCICVRVDDAQHCETWNVGAVFDALCSKSYVIIVNWLLINVHEPQDAYIIMIRGACLLFFDVNVHHMLIICWQPEWSPIVVYPSQLSSRKEIDHWGLQLTSFTSVCLQPEVDRRTGSSRPRFHTEDSRCVGHWLCLDGQIYPALPLIDVELEFTLEFVSVRLSQCERCQGHA